MLVQMVHIPISFGIKKANEWINEHGFKKSFRGIRVKTTEYYFKYIQADLRKESYAFKTLPDGVKIIFYGDYINALQNST